MRARATIAAGMVAENSIVCRVSGVRLNRRSTSGRKPRSSISSASSSTSAWTCERSRALRLARSMRRPGVPTTMSTPDCEGVELGVVADAAVDGEDAQPEVLAGEVEVVGDLERELAGRRDDQRLRLALRQVGVGRVVHGDAALHHRDAEGEGLAGARAGLADQVGAHQGDREGHLLDGEGGGDAGALERVADQGEHPELTEGGGHVYVAFLFKSSSCGGLARESLPRTYVGAGQILDGTGRPMSPLYRLGCEHD